MNRLTLGSLTFFGLTMGSYIVGLKLGENDINSWWFILGFTFIFVGMIGLASLISYKTQNQNNSKGKENEDI